MKGRILLLALFLVGFLVPLGLLSQGMGGAGPLTGKYSYNPKPFDKFGVAPSGLMNFLASEKGRQLLRMSPNPVAKGLLKFFGEEVSGPAPLGEILKPPSLVPPASPTSAETGRGCGRLDGTRFNLEPRTGDPAAALADGEILPMPQNEESVDFLPHRVGGNADLIVGAATDSRGMLGALGRSVSGYYVHTSGRDCRPQFEGGLPSVVDPNGVTLTGMGEAVVAADPSRDAFFAGDMRFGVNSSGTAVDTAVGVFRTTATTLTNTAVCPPGSHEYNDAACWPSGIAANTQSEDLTTSTGFTVNKPHLAVDERPTGSGTGAGDVYVTDTLFNVNTGSSTIQMGACNNSLSACSSSPITISGSDGTAPGTFTQLSHVSVRPDGGVTVTYVDVVAKFPECFAAPFPPCQTFHLKYVTCTPAGAPNPPTCAPPALIVTETQPLIFGGSLAAENFQLIATYPKHDHQVEPDGTIQTIVVWDRCKVPAIEFGFTCPDADVVMTASNNNGATWSPVTSVNTDVHDQFFPWVKTDRSTNTVNIVYYNSENDFFHHRVQVFLNQIRPGTGNPNQVGVNHVITIKADDPAADPVAGAFLFGQYIGVAARGGRVYTHYTYNTSQGIYSGGVLAPEQNNHLSRLTTEEGGESGE